MVRSILCLALAALLSSTHAFMVPSFAPLTKRAGRAVGPLCSAGKSAKSMEAFEGRYALKVISGLRNFDPKSVASVVRAANAGGATHVDIACSPDLVTLARSLTDLPVIVSAVEPELFIPALKAGADMVEIGNYDGFYAEGRVFSAEEVLKLCERTRDMIGNVPLSVTVPHTLPLDEQVSLALELQRAGAHIIQTEGGMPMKPSAGGIQGLIEKAAPTLAATAAISQAVHIPTMAASGISHVTAPLALASGAAGVGVGSAINKLNSEVVMIAAVRQIRESMAVESARVRQYK